MEYQLRVSDNNNTNIYNFNTLADLSRERTSLISAYNYNKKHGFIRSTYEDIVIFKHAVYSTVVFETIKTKTRG